MKISKLHRPLIAPLSYSGAIMAILFFSFSLSPSLLPRPYLLQGVLSGFMLSIGYALGVVFIQGWTYFQLPFLKGKYAYYIKQSIIAISIGLYLYTIYFSSNWQNNLRILMSLPLNESSSHIYITLIALSLAFLILLLTRGFLHLSNYFKHRLKNHIPQRVATAFSLLLLSSVLIFFTNNFLIKKLLVALDNTYYFIDENIESEDIAPTQVLKTGSEDSHIVWDSLGAEGKNFINGDASQKSLEDYFQQEVKQPLRVYVGLRSEETAKTRAALALKELIRVKAFERAKLVIATPTGTGWIDPLSIKTFEYLHKGDTATVTMQYSYLPSWLTLLVDPSSARVSSAALYNEIHRYWSSLPQSQRPELYLFGLSLGALGAETSINLTTIIENPIQGALLVGAPFASTVSPLLTESRNVGSTQILPQIGDGSMVRYMGQEKEVNHQYKSWGPMRFVYVQYASDPIVFFADDFYMKEPDWMKEPRGFDVSQQLTWVPIITFFQVLFDIPMADKVPRGNAHNYSASSYIDGWFEVSSPQNWVEEDNEKLKQFFSEQVKE